MALKQSSFNFDFPESNSEESTPVVEETEVVNEKAAEIVELITEEIVFTKEKPVSTEEPVKKSSRGRMKLSEMNAKLDQPEIPEDDVLFEKRYYSIGTVSEMFKVKQSLIRYWENEFDILKPKKNGKGDRFFRPEDVKNLKLIYHLLRERKYTIEGAKEFLKKNKKADEKFAMTESLKKLKSFLYELKANL